MRDFIVMPGLIKRRSNGLTSSRSPLTVMVISGRLRMTLAALSEPGLLGRL
jgi:hypothetical protein